MGTSFYGNHGTTKGGGTTVVNADWEAEQGQDGYIKNKPDIDVDENGMTLAGNVVLTEDPDENMEAATKQYVDNNTMHASQASGDSEHLIFNFGV
jgi:hypothetical protein